MGTCAKKRDNTVFLYLFVKVKWLQPSCVVMINIVWHALVDTMEMTVQGYD